MLNHLHGQEACPASAGWNLGKTFAQIVVFWTVFLFVAPQAILQAEARLGLPTWQQDRAWAMGIGSLLFISFGALGLWSASAMAVIGRGTPMPQDCARNLVVVGPYRYLRNPMAVAGLTQAIAVGIFCDSPSVVAYALTGMVIWQWLVRPWEEADLQRRFGAAYRRYRQAIRCWVPTFPGYQANAAVLPARISRAEIHHRFPVKTRILAGTH